MVDALKAAKLRLSLAALIAIVCTVLACGDASQEIDPPATPTPVPDPVALLEETAANLRAVQSARFQVNHEVGSMYLPAFSARITDITGSWDAAAGTELSIDAYLVHGPEAAHESGSYVRVRAIITPDGYFSTEPISGVWLKQPASAAPVSVSNLQHIVADLVDAVERPALVGEEASDGIATYRISGDAPATSMDWLPIAASTGQSLRVEVWTDTARKMLTRLSAVGAVGEFDAPDTHRTISLTAVDEPVIIVPPEQFIDLTGG